MSDLLKNMYNRESVGEFAKGIKSVYPPFQKDEFMSSVMDDKWDELELKGRMRHITNTLGEFLPVSYPEALSLFDQIAHNYEGFIAILFSDFVEVYGQDKKYWDISIKALENYTQYCSSEFAVRPFIINHQDAMMEQMMAWSKSDNEHVRRLASEGCRPALPWAMSLPEFKKDPTPVLPILEQLKTDSSKYVQKSVANNLNDISKTHPQLVAKLAKDWYGVDERTDWIVKHGCRTLLKKGYPEVLAVFGFHDASSIKMNDFIISPSTFSIGDELSFSFTIQGEEATKIRLEYAIDFVKANGKRNRKVFQISESTLKANERKTYNKTHSFADLSTRKHYPGLHSITLIINGVERGALDFEVR